MRCQTAALVPISHEVGTKIECGITVNCLLRISSCKFGDLRLYSLTNMCPLISVASSNLTVLLFLTIAMPISVQTCFFRPAAVAYAFLAPSTPAFSTRPVHTCASRLAPLRDYRRAVDKPLRCFMKVSSEPSLPSSVTGPSWQLEYESLDASTLLADIATAERLTKAIEKAAEPLKPLVPDASSLSVEDVHNKNVFFALIDMTKNYWAAVVLFRNVATQAGCTASVDGSDAAAKKMSSSMQVRFARLRQAYEPAALFLDLCSNTVFNAFLRHGDDEIQAAEYVLRHSRLMRSHKLTLQEENIMTTMSVTGHSAWGTLYTDLSSVIPVNVKMPDGSIRSMGIASADAMRDNPDARVRQASWEGIRSAWLPHRETCAATLNAITGWRLDEYKKRGYPSFLTSSLHQNRMSNATLHALLAAIDESNHVGRQALQVQARSLGKQALHPWDLFAPAPVNATSEKIYSFEEGIELIANAVADVDREAGKFVRMMRDEKWIEASRGDKKRPGAYCTKFAKSRTPRVYLSDYNGGAALLLTLAHELGHAFHSWVMRDLPQAQLGYPMNLAETASIFFETVVGNKLLEEATSPQERFNMLWGEAESAGSFLLNLPARFRFEEELNERRANGPLSVDEIDDMMVRAWTKYYGDALTEKERVGVFSQSKLHFYLTGISFYNWPYCFGYLFALGIYAEYQHGRHGSFSALYRDLLRDTGRMDAEDVVEKHLGARIDDIEFWKRAIGVTKDKIEMFVKAAEEVGNA